MDRTTTQGNWCIFVRGTRSEPVRLTGDVTTYAARKLATAGDDDSHVDLRNGFEPDLNKANASAGQDWMNLAAR